MTTDKNYTVYVSNTWNPVNLYSVYSGGSLDSAYVCYDEQVKKAGLDSKHTRVEIICTETTKTCIASRNSAPIDTQTNDNAPELLKETKAEENLLRKHLGLDWDDTVSTS